MEDMTRVEFPTYMEDMTRVQPPPKDDQTEITRSLRDLPPAHYIFKIENFSLLSNTKVDNFESSDFEVEGYKWCVVQLY